ncbi:MAG: Glu/Leu/Phe/Val dehydrogenase dimerization domain-containing protein [Acidobacteriota bacterium]
MGQELLSVIESWDGNGVVTRFDPPTGAWIFIGLHDSTLGPPTGGTRIKVYPELSAALTDAVRLAEGMTYKWAGLNMSFGGGKAVLALPKPIEGEERRGLLQRYGAFIESLSGSFKTGADLGASSEDMVTIATRCSHVLGVDYTTMTPTDPGPFTAHGVLCGIQAALEKVFGSEDVAGRSVLIQGLGGVGAPLARSLAEEDAEVILSDLDEGRAKALAQELSCRAVASDQLYATPCDVYAPCAVGATLNHQTIQQLACRIVAGSANNQLLEEDDADRLHQRDILYVPDYIINSGGAMAIALMREGLTDRDELMQRVATIRDAVGEILKAAVDGTSPVVAARQRVDRILQEHRASS